LYAWLGLGLVLGEGVVRGGIVGLCGVVIWWWSLLWMLSLGVCKLLLLLLLLLLLRMLSLILILNLLLMLLLLLLLIGIIGCGRLLYTRMRLRRVVTVWHSRVSRSLRTKINILL